MESEGFMFDPSFFRCGNMFLGNDGDSLFRGTNTLMGLELILKRQSFFEASDMLFYEGYYDGQLPDKKHRLTPEQVQPLEKSFETENKLKQERKAQLAKRLRLQPRQVAVWFQNRRARWKTKQLERDYDLLKSSYDTLLSNFDSITRQNRKLKLEIASLNKELQTKDISAGATAVLKSDTLPPHEPLQVSIKAEDQHSPGSGGSVLVDDDSPNLLDSGNSCFPGDEYDNCVAAEQWEKEHGNNHGSWSYFWEAFAVSDIQSQEEGVPLGWWPWP